MRGYIHTSLIGLLTGLAMLTMAGSPALARQRAKTAAVTARIVIFFYSVASGPVAEDQKAIDSLVGNFEAEHKLTLKKSVAIYGMEGDFAYCFGLAEISGSDQVKFVARVRAAAKRLKQVSVGENVACPGR